MGRFINADVTVYTGQGFIGCNMYAYCINNPTNHFDSEGTDAVWIQEKDTVPFAGHTGLLVENEEDGRWYFFYWGMDSESTDICNVIKAMIGTVAKLVWKEIDTDDFDLTTTEGVKKALQNSNDPDVNRSDKVTGSIYFQGDFSDTIEYIEKLSENTPQYNLFKSNCVQHSTKALQCSNPIFRGTRSLIPNIAFNKANVVSGLLNILYTYATID